MNELYILTNLPQNLEFFNPSYWGREGQRIVRRGEELLERAPLDICMQEQIRCVFRKQDPVVYEFIKRN